MSGMLVMRIAVGEITEREAQALGEKLARERAEKQKSKYELK
jgi:hypothetical protein